MSNELNEKTQSRDLFLWVARWFLKILAAVIAATTWG
jgi:hypothetical protein